MKKLTLLLLLIGITFSFSGCAYLHSLDADLPAKIDRWIQEEKYRTALDTLQHIKPGHKDYTLLMQKKRKILSITEKETRKTISQASQHVAKNEWHKADQLYQSTLQKLPASQKLDDAYQKFLNQRQQYLDRLETRLMINKGDWLRQNASIYNRIKTALPEDYDSVNGMRDYEQDREKALKALIECALTANSADNLGLARRCLYLAEHLDSSVKDSPRLGQVRDRINAAQEERQQRYKQQILDLLSELRQGNSLDNLQRTRDLLHSSSQYSDLDDPVLGLLEKLRRRLETGINQRMESARRLYSQGKIEAALQVWESLQNIAPDNQQLDAHIERARRVLDKLQRLQQQGETAVNPPPARD